jgi:peptidyl-prolyl cis-trans isomerase D
MLKVFRENLKYLSWILWLVIAVFIAFVFVDFGGGLSKDPSAPANYAAKVGSEEVSVAEFQQQYRALESQYRQIYGERFSAEVAQQMQLPMQALERAVSQKVLVQEARRQGLSPTDDEVRRTILTFESFHDEKGAFIGDREYKDLLRANNQTPASFERSVREELAVAKLMSVLRSTLRVSDQEVEKSYRAQAERATIRYVLVPSARFASAAPLTDAEVRAYFDAHPDEFRLGEQRVVDYLLVDTSRVQQTLSVTEAEAQAYYDSHTSDYTREEEVRARHILLNVNETRTAEAAETILKDARARLERGEDFTALAKELSDDASNKDQGGDLGFFGRGRMIQAFEDAAFGAQNGQLVGPLRTDFGMHLIRVEERRAGGQQTFAEVRPQIEVRLRGERAQAMAEAKAKSVRTQLVAATADAAKMKSLADTDPAALSLSTSLAFTREDLIPGIGRGSAFATAAFDLAAGQVSEPVRVPRGWAVLVLREVRPPHAAQFAEVADKARASAEAKRRQQMATATLQRARSEALGGRSLDDIARELGVQVQDSGEFGATGTIQGLGLAANVAAAALALNEGQIGGPLETPQGGVLFQVTQRQRFDASQFAASKDETRTTLERQAMSDLLGALIDRQRQELGVNYNRQLLEQWGVVVPGEEKAG